MICYGKPLETPLIQLDKFGDWLVMGSFMSEIVESRYSPLKLTYPLPANRYFWDHDFLAWKRLVGYVPRSLEGNQVPKNSGHYMTPTQTMHYYIWEIPKKSPYIFIKFDRSQTGSHLMTEHLNLQKKMPRKKRFLCAWNLDTTTMSFFLYLGPQCFSISLPTWKQETLAAMKALCNLGPP